MTITPSSWLKTLLIIGSLIVSTQSSAKEYWYQFDMIIFSQESQHPEWERTPRVTIHNKNPKAVSLKTVDPLSGYKSASFNSPLISVPKELSQLVKEHKLLTRSNKHIPLWFGSWRMPLTQNGKSITIAVQGGRHIGGSFELEGSVEFALRRFMHIDTALWINSLDPNLPSPSHQHTGRLPYIKNRPFNASQKVDLNTLVYIDNPDAGILLKVSHWSPPKSARSMPTGAR